MDFEHFPTHRAWEATQGPADLLSFMRGTLKSQSPADAGVPPEGIPLAAIGNSKFRGLAFIPLDATPPRTLASLPVGQPRHRRELHKNRCQSHVHSLVDAGRTIFGMQVDTTQKSKRNKKIFKCYKIALNRGLIPVAQLFGLPFIHQPCPGNMFRFRLGGSESRGRPHVGCFRGLSRQRVILPLLVVIVIIYGAEERAASNL